MSFSMKSGCNPAEAMANAESLHTQALNGTFGNSLRISAGKLDAQGFFNQYGERCFTLLKNEADFESPVAQQARERVREASNHLHRGHRS